MSCRALFCLASSQFLHGTNARSCSTAKLAGLAALLAALQVFPASRASAQDMRIGYPQQYSMSPKGVNLQKGNLVYQQTDISVGPLKLTRMYGTGGSATQSGFGTGIVDGAGHWQFRGWTHNYTSNIYIDNSTNTPYYHVSVEGTQYTFKLSGAVVPADGPAQAARLVPSGPIQAGGTTNGYWVMSDGSGNQYTFSGTGYVIPLQSILYANGSSVAITYNSGGQPKLISSNLGYAIVLDYNANQTISAACGYNTAQSYVDSSTTCGGGPVVKVTYGYDATPRLTSVTDARLGVTSFSYTTVGNTSNLLSCISLVNSSSCAIQNTYGETMMSDPDQVTTQTTAVGNVWHYDYGPPENPVDVPQKPCWPYWSNAWMTDANGGGYSATYDRGYLVELGAPDGTSQYLYPNGCATYGAGGIAPVSVEVRLPRPYFVRKPGGVREYYDYDSRGNPTKRAILPIGAPDPTGLISSDPDLSRCCTNIIAFSPPPGSLVYQTNYLGMDAAGCSSTSDAKLCNKPISTIDPNGNETDYTYDPVHGGILTETEPAVNGIRPQTRYSYVQRQAWVKSAGGGYVQTGQPVWLLARKSTCKTGAAASSGVGCALGSGDEVITTYDYGTDSGPNNLLLRGVVQDAGGLNLRTCYTYDAQGNKISETKPRGTGGTCP